MSQELRRKIEARRRIYLVRHGEVSYFDPAGRPHPHRSVPLNEDGRKQALEARDALARVPIDRAVCTGLPRTQETAEIILAGRDLRPETLTALQEVSPGPFAKESLGALTSLSTLGLLSIAVPAGRRELRSNRRAGR